MSKQPNKISIDQLLTDKKKHADGLDPEFLIKNILNGNRASLSEAITLVESTKPKDQDLAQIILKSCIGHSKKSIRIGITGVPGVGKSTFIETFGTYLIENGKKVAVLAIDPSSERSGGSILGDKTRMVNLSTNENAFIRPTATGGSLGGVARKTRESILLCEAAGYDVILIETVGVGQSEIAVHSMTDFFLLLMLSGAGDELQGIKRGIMEMADTLMITKADGDNVKQANFAKTQYKSALHLFPPGSNGWTTKVGTTSALENNGIDSTWKIIEEFEKLVRSNGSFETKRNDQQVYWLNESLNEKVLADFYNFEGINQKKSAVIEQLKNNEITSYQASELIMEFYKNGK